jgi:AcrR family transcriptional regulator
LRLSIRCRIDGPVALVRTPRDEWVDAALEALAEGGPDAVRVEALAVRLGVSKGGFYWHFTGRPALVEEMLDAWQRAAVEDVIDRIESHPAGPRAKLQKLFELAMSADGLSAELAVRDWSRRDSDVAERLHQVDNRRMGYLRSLFAQFCVDEDDVEARSMLAFSLYVGSHFVVAEHGDRTRPQVLQLAWDRLLSESWG